MVIIMKYAQKFKFLSAICILFITLSACNDKVQTLPQDTNMDKSLQHEVQNTENEQISEAYISKVLTSGTVVEASVEIDSHVNLNELITYSAEIVKLDYDLLKQLLLADKEIVEEGSQEMADARTDELYHYCIASDGSSLSYTGEGFSFTNNNYALIQRIINAGDVDLTQFRDLEDLSFISQEDAEKNVKTTLDQLGLEVNDPPVCYTLNFASLQSICNQLNTLRKEAAGENLSLYTPLICNETDACYIFIYQINSEGLPISTQANGVFGDGSWTSGTSLLCVYSEQGIIAMELPYSFKITGQISQATKGLNVEHVLERLDNKLNSIILNGDYQVNKITFEYVPMPINGSRHLFELIPAWRLSIIHTYQYLDSKSQGELYSAQQEFDVVFNACTGEEIISSSGSV